MYKFPKFVGNNFGSNWMALMVKGTLSLFAPFLDFFLSIYSIASFIYLFIYRIPIIYGKLRKINYNPYIKFNVQYRPIYMLHFEEKRISPWVLLCFTSISWIVRFYALSFHPFLPTLKKKNLKKDFVIFNLIFGSSLLTPLSHPFG